MTRRKRKKKTQPAEQWYKMDLHIHTPASADHQQKNVTYLEILQEAERRGLDIIAFTDHNTVAGYKQMLGEIDDLELLKRLNRLKPEEEKRLQEYRRLQEEILLLTGFEFTATFGFHILGIFPPETSIRELEFLLLQMNVPAEKLDDGATEVGATVDVLTAYQMIAEAGGLVIAAHANSSHGVALQGIRFGGQTRIAFTQDLNLHALEVTDLEKADKKSTARFFDGSKPEYPRRMRCIQGSDTHRLTRDPNNVRNSGIGDRVTEILLDELSFAALRDVFTGDDFARTRPYRSEAHPFDFIQAAREEGPNIVQDFHDRFSRRGGFLDAIAADVCAFANTNGGTLYIGASTDAKVPPIGLGNSPTRVINALKTEIETRITPTLPVNIDVQETQNVKIVRMVVPRGDNPPYTLDESQIFIRSEAETTPAVRDEIVELVRRSLGENTAALPTQPAHSAREEAANALLEPGKTLIDPPRTGVEIAAVETRNNVRYYTMRDLRNGSVVNNVTRNSARRLWRYAIDEAENNPMKPHQVRWMGNIGIWKQREYSSQMRYDLVQKIDDEQHVYYGVTEEGIHGAWTALIGD
ncbi:MAG TPA: putative DNA binding domain-containing protein [Anaerolineae bacterium]|nr:putative DNA binding domain-containing protein [Anaerolineae bacterium]HQI85844.1 putative DNA binding domain-containing protein [Anaerolineae bacterium]